MAVSAQSTAILDGHFSAAAAPHSLMKLHDVPSYHSSAMRATLIVTLPDLTTDVFHCACAQHMRYSAWIAVCLTGEFEILEDADRSSIFAHFHPFHARH